MASFNKVILLGNLTRDPEMRTTNSGTSICKLGVAMTRVGRGSDGESREEVVFVDVDAYGKQAEVIGRYFSKGKPIFIEGRLRLDQWESASGEKRSKLNIVLENFQFISGARLDDDGGSGDANFSGTSSFGASNFTPAAVAAKGSNVGAEGTAATAAAASENAFDEDVPF
ncbi:MAG: single-stranded DNA-binding protein [Puniceicoccales bacterium]|jgi:single-strand DNA-binding protein|nr:single-stranded DNA-binding protein [Puniceicoccales bacterium]